MRECLKNMNLESQKKKEMNNKQRSELQLCASPSLEKWQESCGTLITDLLWLKFSIYHGVFTRCHNIFSSLIR